MSKPNWKEQFPDYPDHAMPQLPAGWEDISWRNDACPNFINSALGVALFIDYPDPQWREYPEYPRFLAYRVDEDGAVMSDKAAVAEGEDFAAVMAAIDAWAAGNG